MLVHTPITVWRYESYEADDGEKEGGEGGGREGGSRKGKREIYQRSADCSKYIKDLQTVANMLQSNTLSGKKLLYLRN